jgi:hypothetical protein
MRILLRFSNTRKVTGLPCLVIFLRMKSYICTLSLPTLMEPILASTWRPPPSLSQMTVFGIQNETTNEEIVILYIKKCSVIF